MFLKKLWIISISFHIILILSFITVIIGDYMIGWIGFIKGNILVSFLWIIAIICLIQITRNYYDEFKSLLVS